MFTKFFINRPIFACVISIVIVIAGTVAGLQLPIAQYPDIVPPTVTVSCNYPGASAKTIADTVALPIEKQVNGVEDMIYMSSNSSSNGDMTLTVTFDVGTDLDMATVLVQNRVAIAQPQLPEEVRRQGITTKKKSTNMVLVINVLSPDDSYDSLALSNFSTNNLKDELSRVPGVGEVQVMDARDFSMRVWLNPNVLGERGLTVSDIVNAVREQNVQVAAGRIGQEPAPTGQEFEYVINTLGRLENAEQFENIIIRTDDQGNILRLKDVARVELGAFSYSMATNLDGKAASTIGVFQLPGANALDVAEGIKAKMKELSASLDMDAKGLEYKIVYDTTKFVTASINEVIETLIIAIILVFLTVYVFLQDLRATLVPALTIPVSLIGTFGMMIALGFSINTLTLFGLVLVIGIVVDDSIVVVENTMRLIDTERLSAKAATTKAMEEVTGPVIATTLVLMAVFVPTAFLGGITGRLYQQFSLTIAGATLISSICALTLAPALCGVLLRPTPEKRNWFFRGFNWGFDLTKSWYSASVHKMLRLSFVIVIVWIGVVGATLYGLITLPTGFVPNEDQGYMFVNVQLPDAASMQRTTKVCDDATDACLHLPGVAHIITLSGYSMLDSNKASNLGSLIIVFEPWEDRTDRQTKLNAIMQAVTEKVSQEPDAAMFAFVPPAIQGLGQAGGFQLQLLDRENAGLIQLGVAANDLVDNGFSDPVFSSINTTYSAVQPQLFVEIDRTKARKLNVPIQEIHDTLNTYLGSTYVNDFNKFNNVYKVMVQSESQYRSKVEDIKLLKVRNLFGEMVPLRSLVQIKDMVGPQLVQHYNIYPTAQVTGQAAPGYSSGQAISQMEELCAGVLPSGMGYDWTGMTYQEILAGGSGPYVIFTLALIFVYLFLAAQYESWGAPISIMLSVPLAIAGAVAAVALRMMDVNVYTQIGLVLLIGLAGKNAILIVEFARQLRHEGKSLIESAAHSAELRFRPILMTSFAFILGVIPLVIASGAGAASRQALGTAVFGGMLAATIVGTFFVPSLYLIVQGSSERLGSILARWGMISAPSAMPPNEIPDRDDDTEADDDYDDDSYYDEDYAVEYDIQDEEGEFIGEESEDDARGPVDQPVEVSYDTETPDDDSPSP